VSSAPAPQFAQNIENQLHTAHALTMNITEIAVLQLKSPRLDQNFLDAAKQSLVIQNEWHITNFPNLPSTLAERASHCFQQIEEPGRILITAKWESVESHWKWIGSRENIEVMESLGQYFVSGSPDDMVLLHVDADIFGSGAVDSHGESNRLLDSPAVSVERMFIDAGKKDEFIRKLGAIQELLKEATAPHLVQGGWRLDGDSVGRQEYVLVTGWNTIQEHVKFRQSQHASQYEEITQLAAQTEMRHFKRFL